MLHNFCYLQHPQFFIFIVLFSFACFMCHVSPFYAFLPLQYSGFMYYLQASFTLPPHTGYPRILRNRPVADGLFR